MPQRAILKSHIEAGRTLFEALDSWRITDQALNELGKRFPEHDRESCLLKSAAINALYNTNVFALPRMADHVHEVLSRPERTEGPALVDKLALLKHRDGKIRDHRSFASKYAHFFLSDQYPIYDQYAVKTMAHHLGGRRVWPRSYVEFFEWFSWLKFEAPFSPKEVDRYLWMAGMAKLREQSGAEGLGVDVSLLFASPDPKIKRALDILR